MDKIKRIFAILIIAALAIGIIATLVCALMGWNEAFKASAWSIVVAPVILYVMLLFVKVLKR